MSKRIKIIVSIVGITIVLLALLGLTYAYYLTRIEGNTNTNSISVTTADLKLTYNDGDGSIIGSNKTLIPDSDNPVGTKVFTVTNNGNETVEDYAVIIENFAVRYVSDTGNIEDGNVTYLKNGEDGNPDMKLVISCRAYKNYGQGTQQESGTCNGMDGFLPEKSDILVLNTINKGITHEYTVILTYLDDGTDQSDDMNKVIQGKFNIIDTKNTIDITGTVENASPSDTVTINSEPKESVIYADGTYKFMGVKPDVHTIKVSSREVGKISIKGGTSASTTGNTTINGTEMPEVTITESSRILTMNLNENVEITKIRDIGKGPLLTNVIIENSKNVSKNDSQTYGYAILGATDTKPAQDINLSNESVLSIIEDNYTKMTGKMSYYFRGNVTNNYLNFAGMCWRIVRIQGDGSIKLILENKNALCQNTTGNPNGTNGIIGFSNYGFSKTSKNYIVANFDNINDSDSNNDSYVLGSTAARIQDVLMAFYNGTRYNDVFGGYKSFKGFTEKEKSYLKTEKWFMGDLSKSYDNTSPHVQLSSAPRDLIEAGNVFFYYNNRTNLKNYTIDLINYGDENYIKQDIGLLTSDEVALSGAKYKTVNSNYYLASGTSHIWWTMSLSSFGDYLNSSVNHVDHIIMVAPHNHTDTSNYGLYNLVADGVGAVRPSIVLDSKTSFVSGDGTQNNPYVIN